MINTKKSNFKSYKQEKEELKGLINQGKNMVRSGKSYTNPKTGKVYNTDHYKKALTLDKDRLNVVNSRLKDEEVGNKLKKSKSSSTRERRLKKYD